MKKENIYKIIGLILMSLIFIVMIMSLFSYSGENKRLKESIEDNLSTIKQLELEKITIFESIEKDSIIIAVKEATILELKSREYSLKTV